MNSNYRLLFGPLAAAILCFGIIGLALLLPGYSHVRQTVSEIGEIGSPARVLSRSCYVVSRHASWSSRQPSAIYRLRRDTPDWPHT
jgi:hypothetical protein